MSNVAQKAVFDQLIAKMEAGDIPWKKPWKSVRPINAVSGQPYQGINFFILSATDFGDHRWLTFKQVQGLGGKIKQGSKAQQIVFYNMLQFAQDDGSNKTVPMLKYFNVFNAEQTEGIEWENVEFKPESSAEEILKLYSNKPTIHHGGGRASYSPKADKINMPKPEHFTSVQEYYSTLFHELIHSTGHESRLKREGIVNPAYFGDNNYSVEELIAEFGSAFLCNYAGIDNTLDNSAAYLRGWIQAIKDKPNILIQAASKAQKAADYIMQKN